MTKNRNRAIVVAFFALSFMIIGWIAPVLFATYVPSNMIIDVHGFSAQNATTNADSHYICFDRTVYKPAAGQTFTELYLISDNSSEQTRTEISFESSDRYYQRGRTEVITSLGLPKGLEEGKYRYLLVVKMELADGRVSRPFTFTSDPFYIKDEVSSPDKISKVECN